jgi:Ca2+-dependent lipid-binding protein
VQLKVLSRITLKPLVDTLPCMGAVTLSLMETPHMDFSLHLFKQFDLMLLPGMRQAATYLIEMVNSPPPVPPFCIAHRPLHRAFSLQTD